MVGPYSAMMLLPVTAGVAGFAEGALMKFLAQLILLGIGGYFLISAVGFGWLFFGLLILVLVSLAK